MPEKNPVQETLEIILEQLRDLDLQAAEKKRTANDLCRVLHQPPIFETIESMASGVSTRPDEYYGRQAPEVIRSILDKRKQANLGAASVSEIYEAMIAGGYYFQTANDMHAKRGIYSILASDPMFHKLPGTGRIGLAAWYPAAKAKAPPAEAKPKKPRRNAGKTAKARKTRKPAAEKSPIYEKANESVGAAHDRPASLEQQNGSMPFAKGNLLKKVTQIIQSLPPEFSTLDVKKKLEQLTNAEVKRGSLKTVLSRLEEKGVLKVTVRGSGRMPNSYQKVRLTDKQLEEVD
jgi:hypothetical protein